MDPRALINHGWSVASNSFPFKSIVFQPHPSFERKGAFASLHITLLLPPSSLPNDASQLDFMEKMRRWAPPPQLGEMTEDDPSFTNFTSADSFIVVHPHHKTWVKCGVEWK